MDVAAMGKCMPSTPHIAVTGGNENRPKSDGQEDWLLPRIPDGITLDHICTKLPWQAFYVLSSVSPAWRHAIQSHSVYEARVRSRTTDTLVVHSHTHYAYMTPDTLSCRQAVVLYSARDERCFELPPIPGVERGIPWSCECVSSEGKIYVLGGAKQYDQKKEWQWQSRSMVSKKYHSDKGEKKKVYKEVYVLDLAGQRQWRRCESMHEGRYGFASGVLNGKIYAFGGDGPSGPVNGSEVYDPEANAWSPIKPMPCQRVGGHTVTLGEEICVYNGLYFDAATAEYAKDHEYDNHEWIGCDFKYNALSLDVYHPTKDEWRVVDPFLNQSLITRTMFEVEGKLHKMLFTDRAVYVSEKNEWEVLPTNSFDVIGPRVDPFAATVVDDVVFAAVGWTRKTDGPDGWTERWCICLLEGRGFGSQEEEVEWQVLPGVTDTLCQFEDIMHAIQL